jgi:nucleoside-diphosphate-sugar epimerase
MKTLNVMILGSSGRLGATLATSFEAAGHVVFRLSIRQWSEASFSRLPNQSIDIVINAANSEYSQWKHQALTICKAGIAIAKHYSATLMFPGNVYNFGKSMPLNLKVDTAQTAQNEKGIIRIAQEQAMQQAARAGLKCIIIRAGDFYGAGTGNWFDRIITKNLKQQQVCYPGPTNMQHAWAYLPDLAAYFIQLATARQSLKPFQIVHFEGHTCKGSELIFALENAVNAKLTQKNFPWLLIKTIRVLIPNGRGLCEMQYLWRVPHRLHNDTLALKPIQNTSLNEAIQNAVS